MREPTKDSIVVDGQWLEIARAEEGDDLKGLIPLRMLTQFPFANDATIPHPDTQTPLPVPFGNLTSYIEHLTKTWGDDSIPVRLLFHRSFSEFMTMEQLLAENTGSHISKEEMEELTKQGKLAPIYEDGKINFPLEK